MIFFIYGFYSLLSQTLLLRETARVFGAHELALAGALAAWLFWTAAGLFLCGRYFTQKGRVGRSWFAGASLAATLIIPAAILAARLAPGAFSPGLQPGLFLMLTGPALLTLPAGLVNGLAIGFGLARRPAGFYAAEAAGAAAAGLFTVLYFRYFPGVSMLAVLGAAALPLAGLLCLGKPFSRKGAAAFALCAAGLAALYHAEPAAWRLRPPAPEPSLVIETEGARLFAAGTGKKTYYEDGRLLSAPEDPALEEAHLPLLAVKKPERILLTGGAAFFLVPEILKHKPKTVEIAEPDRFKAAFLAGETGAGAAKVKTLVSDLRGLPPGTQPYDLIFQTTPSPDNAALNRDFTAEFFAAAAPLLKPGGLLVFQLPFAANYVPPGKAYTAASVLAAAGKYFPSLTLIPGERLTVLAGAKAPDLAPARLAAAYERRRLRTRTVVPSAFPFLLDPYRMQWARHEVGKIKAPPVNSDLAPLAYFQYWRAWLSMVVSPGALLGLAALALGALCAGLALAGRLSFTTEKRTGEAFFMGFWGMAFETALLLAFQARTGRLNPELGGLFAVFMAAAALGALIPAGKGRGRLLLLEAAAAALALTCAFKAAAIFASGGMAVWGLMAAGGALTGAFFASAAGSAGGEIYGWDILGGAAGGFITAAFAAPVLGIKGALYCAALSALAALAGWTRARSTP
ncbi:MAG TPA: hypothetical protein DCZ92_01045 [Elusimicrobia bacterium]|nr:MAG: hypothetical protein A2016_04740 [Elusimicrobia bacterium GWF2_62_30]HBA59413.1 hypothetical protein [Elusimicrobiota bacterium]